MTTYTEISQLFHRYADYIDRGKLTKVAELLKECTISDSDGRVLAAGYDQVLAMNTGLIRIYPETGTPQTQHIVTNLIVEAEAPDQTIKASANFTVMQKLDSGSVEAIICGKYKNVFKRIDGSWRFHKHSPQPRIIGDMSRHLLIEINKIDPV